MFSTLCLGVVIAAEHLPANSSAWSLESRVSLGSTLAVAAPGAGSGSLWLVAVLCLCVGVAAGAFVGWCRLHRRKPLAEQGTTTATEPLTEQGITTATRTPDEPARHQQPPVAPATRPAADTAATTALISTASSSSLPSLFSFKRDEETDTGQEMMIQKHTGSWTLRGGNRQDNGNYTYDPKDGAVKVDDQAIALFSCDPISQQQPLPLERASTGDATIPCITVTSSEIMAEIAKPENVYAYFVLPSQLNGAEYPSHNSVIRTLDAYRSDQTGGPRGQLAVHPAAGQFVLDNAASSSNPTGINAMDTILARCEEAGFPLELVNGYLKIPPFSDYQAAEQLVKENLHTLRPLVMSQVLASGLDASQTKFNGCTHRVTLVYASAVPVEAYLNGNIRDQDHRNFMVNIAELVLLAQYYGALKHAACSKMPKPTRVFLMPLGGGVFRNSRDSIATTISKAVEMLTSDERNKLDIRVLTFKGSASETAEFPQLLQRRNKLKRA